MITFTQKENTKMQLNTQNIQSKLKVKDCDHVPFDDDQHIESFLQASAFIHEELYLFKQIIFYFGNLSSKENKRPSFVILINKEHSLIFRNE